ncbi:hypothetical protein D3C80_1555270 [compost metagenome]
MACNVAKRATGGLPLWHCRHRPLPSTFTLLVCGSWQSVQPTPALYILLCVNEPNSYTSPSIWPSA